MPTSDTICGDPDVAVVGGGLIGACVAWGLARLGQRVVVLDEGDAATRASRANFALVWVQGKGIGLPAYAHWTLRAAHAWPQLAAALKAETGLDVQYRRPGGFHPALSAAELDRRRDMLTRLQGQAGMPDCGFAYPAASDLRTTLPQIGPEVAGASYCPHDGHVNSLRFLRAIHLAMAAHGAVYRPGARVTAIARSAGVFHIATEQGMIRAGKVVLAAGNANQQLAPMVGLEAPMGPTRGQILVTERLAPFLDYPMTSLRQSDEGTVMIGDSREEATDDGPASLGIAAVMADRARRIFPLLGTVNVVRMWSGIRVMPRDGFPIYDHSASHPGAFVVCCHSGVTLAPNHAFDIAPMIAAGRLDAGMVAPFSARRFAAAGGPAITSYW